MRENANVEQRHRDEAIEVVFYDDLSLSDAIAQALANLEQRVREDEREECARVCEELARRKGHITGERTCQYAAAIRERGKRKDFR